MADYIDRDKLLEYIEERFCAGCGRKKAIRGYACESCQADDIIYHIKEFPALKGVQVRRAHWCYDNETGKVRCSECGDWVTLVLVGGLNDVIADVKGRNFCQTCGAYHDGTVVSSTDTEAQHED